MDEDWAVVSENCEMRRLFQEAEETECVCGRSTDGKCHCNTDSCAHIYTSIPMMHEDDESFVE